MYENRRAFNQCLVAFRWIFFGGMPEKARANGQSDPIIVVAGRNDVVLVSIHDAEQLLPDILSALHTSCLDIVLLAKDSDKPNLGSTTLLTS